MIPRLYAAGSTVFTSEGLGALSDAISCVTTTAINGVPSLTMTYPTTGVHASEIGERCVIVADRDRARTKQPYMVLTIDKSTPGLMKIYCEHLAVCLADGVSLKPYTASGIVSAISDMGTHTVEALPITISTELASAADFNHAVPSTVKRAMGGMEGSLLDTYGGEWDFVDLTAVLRTRMGADNHVILRWGKNLTSLQVNIDWSGVYTGIYPFWEKDGTVVQMSSPVYSLGTFSFTRDLTLDLSSEYQTAPSEADLLAAAQAYASEHVLTTPTYSWSVGFLELRGAPEYASVALLEDVSIGDTVRIYLPDFDINASARVVKETYDVLLEQYQKLEIGSVKANLAQTITKQAEAANNAIKATANDLYNAIQEATEAITGNTGGYIVTVLNSDGEPQELLIMDTDDITTATEVWRWNVSGLGHSSTGYAGPYTTAITADGQIVADFITTGTLNANLVTITNLIVDHLRATNGTRTVELDNSGFVTKNGTDYRLWAFNKSDNTQGALFVYGGTRANLNGNAVDAGNDSTSRMTYIDANGIAIGLNNSDVATGDLRVNDVYARGELKTEDSSNVIRNTIYEGLYIAYDSSGTRRIRISEDGNIRSYGSNGQERIGLYPAEPQIAMYNSSGTRIGRWRPDLNYEGSVSGGTAVGFTLEDGEAAMIMYTADSGVGNVDITLKVNGNDAANCSYTYAGATSNYTGKIFARAGSGTFVGWIACHDGLVEVYGSGRRGTSDVRGDVMLVYSLSYVSNLTFSQSGTVQIKRVAM